jgi:hypothetical protein
VLKAMLLTKLKVASWAVGVALLVGVGAAGLTYRATAQDAPSRALQQTYVAQGAALAAQQKTRAAPDDLESLRLEIEALRRELRATKDLVKQLQAEVRGQKAKPTHTDVWGHLPEAARREAEAANALFKLKADKLKAEEAASRRAKEASDPLAELEDAVKRLRQDPQDKRAAEALDRALRRLKERTKPEMPGGPRKQRAGDRAGATSPGPPSFLAQHRINHPAPPDVRPVGT